MKLTALLLCAFVATAHAGHSVFALIVTNNRGTALGRPDLQYADDDGVHYFELFQTLAPVDNVHLLTELDRDTAKLFPALHPSPPSRANVLANASLIGKQVAAAVHDGDTVDFYFVFAGHGDVDHGRGFIELADGAFDDRDLESLLASIPATHEHVILDSCNSFFMVTPRKPGGRRITTPKDAAAGLAQRMPNVGVFVSTSAEAEVFEWSELQSGVFSHAVRSGLAGAADANGDGVISYLELRAFVDTATADVPNAAFRPKVFARGPGGDDAAALFAPTLGPRLTIAPPASGRLTIRDRDELPWIDANQEPGWGLVLRLPPGLAGGVIQHRDRRVALPSVLPDTLALAELEPAQVATAARGPDEVFGHMFERPFGPISLARYEVDRANAPPMVFGVAHDDVERMRLLLDQVDDEERESRRVDATVTAATGAFFIAQGNYDRDPYGGIAGALIVALGAQRFWSPSTGETLRADFLTDLAQHQDPALVVAKTDARMQTLAAEAKHKRHFAITASIIDIVATGTLFLIDRGANRVFSKGDDNFDTLMAVCAVAGAAELYMVAPESPIERTAHAWNDAVHVIGIGGSF